MDTMPIGQNIAAGVLVDRGSAALEPAADLLSALRPEPIAQFAEISRTSTGEVRMDDHGSDVAEREVHIDIAAPLALRVVVVAMIVRELRIERLDVREELPLEGAGH